MAAHAAAITHMHIIPNVHAIHSTAKVCALAAPSAARTSARMKVTTAAGIAPAAVQIITMTAAAVALIATVKIPAAADVAADMTTHPV